MSKPSKTKRTYEASRSVTTKGSASLEAKKKELSPTTPDQWASAALRDPEFRFEGGPVKVLSEMPRSFDILETSYNTNLYVLLSYVYEIAAYLRDDPKAWVGYIQDPAWNGVKNKPRSEDRLNSLRSVMRMAVGLHGDAASKLASKYHAGLAEAFRRNARPEDIGGYIESGGGIEQLARDEADRNRESDHDDERAQTFDFGQGAKLTRTRTRSRVRYVAEVVRDDIRATIIVERTFTKPMSKVG